jgi:ArsR family transcriptional regulator, arsenate/arsenite/antimonite-responsive transcriptional repressor
VDARGIAKIAKALADPTRAKMLRELREAGQLSCSEVSACCTLAQPTISHHVQVLQKAGVVKVRRKGPYNILSVDEDLMTTFARAVAGAPRKPRRAKN